MSRARRRAPQFVYLLMLAWWLSPVLSGQAPPRAKSADRAAAYYNFTLGQLYAELAGSYNNRSEYLLKAIEHYKLALRLDPSATFLFEELTDLYIQAGRLKDAVTEAEDLLKQDPENLDARRILGRIYSRLIGDPQQGKVNENMLRSAIEQYQKITEKDPRDLESWLTLGRLHRADGNSVEAEKAYKRAIESDSSNEEALTGLAMVYSDVGDTKRSIEMLKLLSERNPSPRTLLALAGSYEQMRDYSSAAEVLRRALALNPDNGRLKRALAQNLLFAEKLDESLKIYQELAAEDPKDMQAPLRMAEIYRQKRNIAQAGAALAKAREIDRSALEVRYEEVNLLEAEGKSEEAAAVLKALVTDTAKKTYAPPERNTRAMLLERLGALYRSVHQPEQSLEAFRQIAELDPEYGPRVALHTIDVWRGERDFAKAREEAEAAVKRYPEDRLVRLSHASLLADLGKVDQAAGEVRSLLKGGKERETYLALAQIYEKGKRFADMEKAIAEAERLSGARQEKEAVHFMRGAMYEKMKKYDLAEAEFGKVLELNPENAGAMNYLGYMLADRGLRLAESEKLISGALQIEPFNGAFLDSLGWAYYRQNRLAEAEAALLRAIERVRRDPTIHDHLGDVYLKQGRIREAMAQWQISLKEWESSPQADQDPEEMAKVSKKLESGRVRLAREHSKTQP